MPTDSNSLFERVAGSIQQLSLVATDLNQASDELGKAISAIDAVLQSLNIGVPTWTTIQGRKDHPGDSSFWSRDIGYAKVGNRWGISLRDVSGDYNWPEDESCDMWLFNDAPRWLRIQGVEKIPDLIDDLVKNTEETTKKIRSKTAEANNLAIAIAQAVGKKPPLSLTAKAVLKVAINNIDVGPTPTEILGEAAKSTVQETREQQHIRERNFNALALKTAKELGKGKK